MNLPTPGPAERRAHPRQPFRTAATLTLPGGQVLPARVVDISKAGAGIVCDLNLPVRTVLSVRMSIPARPSGSAAFEARAVVVNCTLAASDGGFRLGLAFEPLSAAAAAALKGIVS